MSRTCTLIGKGPSAENADGFIELCPETDVAVINDAAKLVTCRQSINYLFFTDVELIEVARPTWPRIERFVCPDTLHRNAQPDLTLRPGHVAGLPLNRVETFPYQRTGCQAAELVECIRERRAAQHHTAMSAQSWLAYRGYTHFRCIGFDGGQRYAAGVQPSPPGMARLLPRWRQAHALLADLLRREMGVETEWFGE